MAALSLRLNPALKARDYRDAFSRDGFVQVPNLFEPDLARGLTEMLERSMPWDLALSTADNGYEVLNRAELSAMGSEAVGSRLQAVSERAAAVRRALERSGAPQAWARAVLGAVAAAEEK